MDKTMALATIRFLLLASWPALAGHEVPAP
jgi:hypothetical protein